MNLEFHPVANIFPLLQGEEFETLKADISANGLIEPIWLHPDGRIIDGRNRYRACDETGTEPKFEIWDEKGSLLNLVLSLNLHRRHLTSSQLAIIAAKIKPLMAEEAKERQRQQALINQPQSLNPELIPDSEKGDARDKAAEKVGTNGKYVDIAEKLLNEAPNLAEQVEQGNLSIPQAKRKLAHQRMPEPEPLEQTITQVDGCKVILGNAQKIDLAQFEKYGVIVADPPWPYRITIKQGTTEGQYETMTDEALRAMPVGELARPDSVLLLWGTWPKIPEALALLNAWGFNYVTGFPWVKTTSGNNFDYGVGYWIRGVSEYVLIGKRGDVSVEPLRLKGFMGLLAENNNGSPGLWLGGPNLQHSRKPDSVHQLAEALPGPYLELFGRRSRHGWTIFGNDAALLQKTLA